MKLFTFLSALVFIAISSATSVFATPDVKDGDIIFHHSQSAQSGAIAAATRSRFTHVGIIFVENGRPMVYEASSKVKATPLDKFIKCGANGHYVVKRLKDTNELEVASLKREVLRMTGRNYDRYFDWGDSTIYCSELVWKAYSRALGIELGELKKMKDFDLENPLVKKTLHSRYGRNVPFEMEVIAPSDIYSCSQLETVASEGTTSQLSRYVRNLLSRAFD